MKMSDIFEAPIQDLEVHNVSNDSQMKGGQRFTNIDVAPVKSKKGNVKIRKMFEKTPFWFNFYLVNSPWPGEKKASPGFIDTNLANKIVGKKIPTKDTITVIYQSNFTTPHNYVPMTGWILAHRISHIFQIGDLSEDYNMFEFRLFRLLKNIERIMDGKEAINRTPEKIDYLPSMRNLTEFRNLVQKLFKMKSARNDKLPNTLDYAGELIAQYLITGKITFNRLTLEDLEEIEKNQPRKFEQGRMSKVSGTVNFVNSLIKKAEVELNTLIYDLLEDLKGKIIVL